MAARLPPSADVVIVGGGVIGSSIAYHLALRGLRPLVVERGHAGGHASLASAGLLHPMIGPAIHPAMTALSTASFARFPALVAALRDTCGLDPELRASGFLWTACSDDEVDRVRRGHGLPGPADLAMRWLDGDEVRRLESAVSPSVRGAVHSPRGAHVYVPALLQAYTQAAAVRGATVVRGARVIGLEWQGDRVAAVQTEDGTVAAGHVVLAGGAWTAQCAAWLGVTLPIYPLRGQILSLYAIPPPVRNIIFGNSLYIAAKAEGSVVVGATYERVGFDDRLTAEGLGWLLSTVPSLVPSLAGATFRQAWVGLRPASPDNMPLLGALPGWANVTIAAGHTAEGVLLSPITGHLIAQLLTGEPPDLDLGPWHPHRFTPPVGGASPAGAPRPGARGQ